VREELRASIEAAEAERNLLIAVEELRDLAFNAPDLSGPAAAIGAEVRVSEPFSLGAGVGLFTDSRLRELAFSDDVKESGNNSEVLELAGQRFVAVQGPGTFAHHKLRLLKKSKVRCASVWKQNLRRWRWRT
jgi:peptidyl-prolyl cis-trans isomerase D